MREGGLEPPRPLGHWHLKPARLPIPPLAQSGHRDASGSASGCPPGSPARPRLSSAHLRFVSRIPTATVGCVTQIPRIDVPVAGSRHPLTECGPISSAGASSSAALVHDLRSRDAPRSADARDRHPAGGGVLGRQRRHCGHHRAPAGHGGDDRGGRHPTDRGADDHRTGHDRGPDHHDRRSRPPRRSRSRLPRSLRGQQGNHPRSAEPGQRGAAPRRTSRDRTSKQLSRALRLTVDGGFIAVENPDNPSFATIVEPAEFVDGDRTAGAS